jgi:sugar lactone lactonase YvrE
VRRTSKASSAGSNSGQSAGLGAARRPGALLALFLALFATACLLPGSALAAETRLPVESFGPDGTAGTSFEYPSTLAFDQGNKHLYALDQAPAKIYGFDTSTPGAHTPLGGNFPVSAEGSEPEWVDDLAVDSTSHNLYFLSERHAIFAEPALYGFDSGGAPLGGNFPFGGFEDACGTAVDPSGDIWVADAGARVIKEYDSSGNPIGSVGVPGHGGPCHVAFDSEANLYVSFYSRGTWRYNAAGGYATSVEIDSEKGTYPFNSNAIAVDRSSDDLYVTHSSHVSVYDSSGAFLYEFGNTVAGARYTGIAIDQGSDQIYVSDYGNGVLRVFGQVVLVPIVLTEDADGVTNTTATLHGTVNPDGNQLTDCHFEFVPASQFEVDRYASVTPAEQATCAPDAASIPADSTGHAVKAEVSGLDPNTTYHFRIVAGTAEGTADGADRTFVTAIGAPTVSAQSVETVGTSNVTLSAKINPKGAKATYHVEYGTTTAYGQSSAESLPIGFPGDNSEHTASVHVGGLTPGTAYHFRFVATNLIGSS